MVIDKLDLLTHPLFHKIEPEDNLPLYTWAVDKDIDTKFQILTVYSDSSILGYVISDSVEYYAAYYKKEEQK